MAVTVLLVDDVSELRGVLRQLLRLRSGFEVVADVGDGASAVTAAAHHQPDVVVLDLGLPDLAGHEVLTGLRTVAPEAQVLVYTGSVRRDRFALAADVEGYVTKDRDATYLVELLVELSRHGRQAAKLDLGPDPADVRLARQFLLSHCRRWGCEDVVEDAQLVASELVTNALVHAGNACELGIAFRSGRLRVEVCDRGSGGPEVRAADQGSEHGRGLLLVSAMSSAWGVEPLPAGGKVVWAELRSASETVAGRDDASSESARRPAGGGTPPPGSPNRGPGFCVVPAVRRRSSREVAVARRLPAAGTGRAADTTPSRCSGAGSPP